MGRTVNLIVTEMQTALDNLESKRGTPVETAYAHEVVKKVPHMLALLVDYAILVEDLTTGKHVLRPQDSNQGTGQYL